MHYSISDYILECVQNSLEAGSTATTLHFCESEENVSVRVEDSGCGIPEEDLTAVCQPEYTNGKKHPGRKLGLGLPFLVQALEQTGGRFELESKEGQGTALSFSFPQRHIDTPPVGSLAETFLMIMSCTGDYDLQICRRLDHRGVSSEYTLTRSELISVLGDICDVQALILLRRYIRSQEEYIRERCDDES